MKKIQINYARELLNMLNNLTNEEKCQVLACAIDGATSSIRSSANKITNVGIELSKKLKTQTRITSLLETN